MRWILFLLLFGCATVELTDVNTCIGTLAHHSSEYNAIAEAGIAWARPHPGPFSWGYTETSSGEYDWSETDKWVKSAQKHGVHTLATVFPYADWDQCRLGCEVSSTDHFARGRNQIPHSRCMPCDINAYATWLSNLVERYDGDGVGDMPGLIMPITHYEILNEPELNGPELTFFIGTPKEYAIILNASYNAVKTACTDCYVLHAGAAGSGNTISYWDEVFSYNVSFDISNIHYIGMWDKQSLNTNDWNLLLQKYGIDSPIWVTEAEITGQEYNLIKNNFVNTERTFLVWYDGSSGFSC